MAEEKKKMSKGCMVALIIVAVIAVIIIALSIVCYVYKDQLVEFGLEKTVDMVAVEIKANLPEGISSNDVDGVVGDFKKALKEKKIKAEKIQAVAAMFQEIMDDKKVDKDEAQKFLKQLKAAIEE